MPRPDLKALRKPVSRYNNSSPRYTRESHYAILAQQKVSQVFKSQDEHNASYKSKISYKPMACSRKVTHIFGFYHMASRKYPSVHFTD